MIRAIGTDAAIFIILLLALRWGSLALGFYQLTPGVLTITFVVALLLRIARWFWHNRDRDYVNEQLRRRYHDGRQ